MEKTTLDKTSIKEKKEIKAVVNGKVTKKKKGIGSKIGAVLFDDNNVGDVKEYVIFDVIVPAVKNAISNAITGGIDMLLFGERRSDSSRSRDSRGYTSYSSRSTSRRDSSRQGYRRPSLFELDDILLPTKLDANSVIDNMFNILDEYGVVSVADYYALVGEPSNYQMNAWGWENLTNVYTQRTRNGEYKIVLPKPVNIK